MRMPSCSSLGPPDVIAAEADRRYALARLAQRAVDHLAFLRVGAEAHQRKTVEPGACDHRCHRRHRLTSVHCALLRAGSLRRDRLLVSTLDARSGDVELHKLLDHTVMCVCATTINQQRRAMLPTPHTHTHTPTTTIENTNERDLRVYQFASPPSIAPHRRSSGLLCVTAARRLREVPATSATPNTCSRTSLSRNTGPWPGTIEGGLELVRKRIERTRIVEWATTSSPRVEPARRRDRP